MTEKLETFIKIGKTFFRHKNEEPKEFIQEFRVYGYFRSLEV